MLQHNFDHLLLTHLITIENKKNSPSLEKRDPLFQTQFFSFLFATK
jgi:hypothetical protein